MNGQGMADMIGANWPAFVVVLAIGLLLAWWLWSRAQRVTRDRFSAPDALDEGAAPAARNQALIDAPSAAARVAAPLAGTGPDILGGMGEVFAAAAAREVDAARGAEAGVDATGGSGAPVAEAGGDDLTRIKGVGPKLSARLAALGITRFAQIAAWQVADIAGIDAQLGPFAGRIERDAWVEQCRYLAAGDVAGFQARFGKL